MELVMAVLALGLLDLVAFKWGADSRGDLSNGECPRPRYWRGFGS